MAVINLYGFDEAALKRLIKNAVKEGNLKIWLADGRLWASDGKWAYRITNTALVGEYLIGCLERPLEDGEALIQERDGCAGFVRSSAKNYNCALQPLFERGLQAPLAALTPWYRWDGELVRMLRLVVSRRDYGFFQVRYLAPLEDAKHLGFRLIAIQEGQPVADAPVLLAYWDDTPVAAVMGVSNVPMDFPDLHKITEGV